MTSAKIDKYIISNCLRLVKNQRRSINYDVRLITSIIITSAKIEDFFKKLKRLLQNVSDSE